MAVRKDKYDCKSQAKYSHKYRNQFTANVLKDTISQRLPSLNLFFTLSSRLPSVCNADYPCEGMSRHATFENFGMAFLTLFQVSTGDNWNGIMKVVAPVE